MYNYNQDFTNHNHTDEHCNCSIWNHYKACPETCHDKACYHRPHGYAYQFNKPLNHNEHNHNHYIHDDCFDSCDDHINKFKPISGESAMETNARLISAVNNMAGKFNDAIKHANGLIHKLEHRNVYNGAYYDGDVITEECYDNTDQTVYKIIHIPLHDKSGNHIKFDLHLPYSNTSNSQINEKSFNASQFQLADKMFTAQIGGNNSWYGHVTWQGAPCPSEIDEARYTLGVNCHGRLLWYRNTVERNQLTRDNIINSFGVEGILVSGKTITNQNMWGNESPTNKTARICVGQNRNNGEIIVLVCGSYDKDNNIENGQSENGITLLSAANIMQGYCDLAVSVAYGSDNKYGVNALDKGDMLFSPSGLDDTNNLGYWFISRKSSFKNNFTFDSATLRQLYGQLKWRYILTDREINNVDLKFADVNNKIINLQNTISIQTSSIMSEIARVEKESKDRDTAIHDRINSLDGTVNGLLVSVNSIGNAVIILQASDVLQNANISGLQNNLSTLQNTVNNSLMDIAVIKSDIINVRNDMNALQNADINLQQQINNIKTSMTYINNTISDLINTVNGIEIDILSIKEDITNAGIDIDSLSEDIQNALNNISTITNDIGNIVEEITVIQNTMPDLTGVVERKYITLTSTNITEYTNAWNAGWRLTNIRGFNMATALVITPSGTQTKTYSIKFLSGTNVRVFDNQYLGTCMGWADYVEVGSSTYGTGFSSILMTFSSMTSGGWGLSIYNGTTVSNPTATNSNAASEFIPKGAITPLPIIPTGLILTMEKVK